LSAAIAIVEYSPPGICPVIREYVALMKSPATNYASDDPDDDRESNSTPNNNYTDEGLRG